MLTKAGVVGTGASVTVFALGRLLGLPELFVVGAAGLLVIALASIYVAIRRLHLEVRRQLTPSRVHAGNPCRVDLHLVNRGRTSSPVLRLRDDVSGTQGVELLIAPMRPGEGTHAVYRLPTDRRGIINVGPMRLTVTDPFGLAQITTTGDREVALIVYPRIDDLRAVRRSSGSDVERHQLLQHQVAPLGDEFYALRQYNVGDDLRRVHWPSSARQDDLMVRQDEIPWHGHLTVLLDTRQGADPAVFEEAVSAAASIAAASIARGDQVRLVTTAGQETPFAAGPYHLDRMLEILALVQPGTQLSTGALERLMSLDSGGAIAGVTASAGELDRGLMPTTMAGYRTRFLIVFADSGATPTRSGGPIRSTTVILVGLRERFADAWIRSTGGAVRLGR
jgi:uncharacterized protein (DUF58 family)